MKIEMNELKFRFRFRSNRFVFFYFDRTPRGDSDHCDSGGNAAARFEQGKTSCHSNKLCKQSKTDCFSHSQLRQ